MFANECLGELEYEATTTSIVMAGLFLSFLTEYIGGRFVRSRNRLTANNDIEPNRTDKGSSNSDTVEPCEPCDDPGHNIAGLGHHHHGLANPDDKLSVVVMEAGIIFHSISKPPSSISKSTPLSNHPVLLQLLASPSL